MAQGTRLREVAEDGMPNEIHAAQVDAAQQRAAQATAMLFAAVRALSQRALVALASTFDLFLVGSAFALWWVSIGQPSVQQLVGLGMYSVFVLAIVLFRKR